MSQAAHRLSQEPTLSPPVRSIQEAADGYRLAMLALL